MSDTKWKARNWALLTVILYAATMCALTWPVLKVCFWKDVKLGKTESINLSEGWPY